MRRAEAAMRPMVAHLKATIAAPLLGCAEAALHCPRRTWYARVGGAGAVDVVHQDVNGPAYEGWLNVWVLLTDGVYGRPLVLLDPGAVDHDALAWEGERAFTFERMRRGDVVGVALQPRAARRRALAAGRGERGRRLERDGALVVRLSVHLPGAELIVFCYYLNSSSSRSS